MLVAKQLDIKGIKTFLDIKPVADTSSELLYDFGNGKVKYYFNFGVVVFSGFSEEEMKWTIKSVQAFQKNPLSAWLREDFEIKAEPGKDMTLEFNKVVVGVIDVKVMRIVMFNLAQSVAIDYFNSVGESLLDEVKNFTNQLETTGKLKISRTNMLRFMGKALNTQNDIAENIYIFDAPELVWDDEYLDKLHQALIKHFDLRVRFSELEYTLRIIEDNLTVFREIYHQRESSLLEWIIIALILVEIIHLIISEILK
ncbi:MAG TPA: RMD1 family protein [Chitinophagales bacterium]|nr:RMD1 family protein [Chitinophagales bacterium]